MARLKQPKHLYFFRDIISIRAGAHAKRLILSEYRVSEDIRRERRRRNPVKARRKDREMTTYRTNEAAKAPQPVEVMAISRTQV